MCVSILWRAREREPYILSRSHSRSPARQVTLALLLRLYNTMHDMEITIARASGFSAHVLR